MNRTTAGTLVALVLVCATLPSPARAQAPLGPEFRVDTVSAGAQAAGLPSGFVVAWTESSTLLARRYSAGGAPLGSAFRVSTYTSEMEFLDSRPAIDAAADGSFVVTWPSSRFNGDVFARRFDAGGNALGAEFMVNDSTTGYQSASSVAVAADGSFMVAWQVFEPSDQFHDAFGRVFAANGTPLTGEFRINQATNDNESQVGVVADPRGGFLVTWVAPNADTSFGILARRYTANGTPSTNAFPVNSYTTGVQAGQSVAFDAAGNFLVAWSGRGATDEESGIFAQRFAFDGSRVGPEFRASRTNANAEGRPSVAAERDGRYLVVWASTVKDGSGEGVFGQLVDGQAGLIGPEFLVNSYTTGYQFRQDVASDGGGRLLVIWTSDSHDGSPTAEVDGQVLGGLRPTALAVDAAGNGMAEPGETATVAPTWLNTNGGALTLTGAVSAFGGPAGGTYTINDGTADYGTLADGSAASCGADCYAVTVTAAARPALHWDAALTETLSSGHHFTYPFHLGDSFGDVPRSSGYYRFVETLLHNGVANGCAAGAYCPGTPTLREQMAVFVLVGLESSGYLPPPCVTSVFADVPATSPYCPWILELFTRGVVSGCGGGNYCPGSAVTREQMAVFVLRTLDPALVPPACTTPVFSDVPATSAYCRWIEELFRRGVVTGCSGGRYCPTDPVTREQMAVFITATFGLTLYGP